VYNRSTCKDTAWATRLEAWVSLQHLELSFLQYDAGYLYSNHDTCVLVPAQQRIVAILCARLGNVCSACHKVLVQICACKTASYCSVHWFHDFKVSRKQNVEVALVDLSFTLAVQLCRKDGRAYKWRRDRNHLPLVPCLDHGGIQPLYRIA
jgi:hypothetical protein